MILNKGKYYKFNNSSFTLKGNDAIDFLNRFTTANLAEIESGQFRYSVLTDYNGHIIDLIVILKRRDDLLIICSPWKKDAVASHLDKYILSEDVIIEKSDFDHSVLLFSLIEDMGFELPVNNIFETDGYYYAIKDPLFNGNIRIIYSKPEDIIENGTAVTDEEFKYFRISNLIPYSAEELNGKIIPLECNLGNFISLNKGCYLGQEVIARITSQDKLPKSMHHLKSEIEFISQEKIMTENSDGGCYSECGFITSTTEFKGTFHALGFIRQNNFYERRKYYLVRNNKYKELILIK